MKRLAFILAIVWLIAGCGNTDVRPHHYGSFDEVVDTPASFAFTETTLAGLLYRAENVVRGRMGDDARIVFQFNDYFNPERPTGGDNLVSLEILEVIQGNLRVGDIITIVEPYSIEDGILYTRDNYLPSIPHQEYFFFLSEQIDSRVRTEALIGAYWVLHGERSRFPVPASGQNLDEIDLAFGSHANVELYMRLWQDVLDAFMH